VKGTSTPLLTAQGLFKSFGGRVLFENVSLNLHPGDRVGLIGPNGSGKSTLLMILAGLEIPDHGTVSIRRMARFGFVPQDCTFDADATIEDLIAQVVDEALAGDPQPESQRDARLSRALGAGAFPNRLEKAGNLSGGWTRRLAIARELASDPDVLLLDEPTNHLDLQGLAWLEALLRNGRFATIVVSHDRRFLDTVATRMVELDRAYPDGVFAVQGGYGVFVARRETFLQEQSQQRDVLANKVRHETEWLRRGPKARGTKARSRVDKAHRLIDELSEANVRSTTRTAEIDFTGTGRRTKRLLVARGVGKSMGGKALFKDMDLVLSPGTRLGLAGANGSGKTTLLRVLAEEITPDNGRLKRAPGLHTVYFDQRREKLDPHSTLRRALAPDGDQIMYRGRPIHVVGWARRFLFEPDRLEVPVGDLSGGEKARVLIANLVIQPADLLLLDEPTNDLDIPTLTVLEDSLLDFPGAVVLVTHDRAMMDEVTHGVIGLDGEGGITHFGDIAQWERARRAACGEASKTAGAARTKPRHKARRLGYLEQRELDAIEDRIEEAEQTLAGKVRVLEDPSIASDAGRLQSCSEAAATAQTEVDALYERWAELEGKLNRVDPSRSAT